MGEPHSTRRLELTGQRFGRLTVIEAAENIGSRTAWRCRCDCGGERVVKTVYLRAGKVKSCGCLCGTPETGAPHGHPDGLRALHFVDGTCVEMLRKRPVRRNNSCGVTGVDWKKDKQRWRASICFKGKRYYLGMYENFDDAVAARKEAEAQMHDAFLAGFDAMIARQTTVSGL